MAQEPKSSPSQMEMDTPTNTPAKDRYTSYDDSSPNINEEIESKNEILNAPITPISTTPIITPARRRRTRTRSRTRIVSTGARNVNIMYVI